MGWQFGGDGGEVEDADNLLYVGGMVKILDWMKAEGEIPDHCLVGKPSNPKVLGNLIKDSCPATEIGLSSATTHKTDEAVAVADPKALTEIYFRVLEAYFVNPPCPA